jgi:uncharacterized protein
MSWIIKLGSKVARLMAHNDAAHRFDHTAAVVRNASRLLSQERCDRDVVIAAALLHDVVGRKKHAFSAADILSAEVSAALLNEQCFGSEKIEAVITAISTGSWEHAIRGGQPESLEAYILRDADILEAMGTKGIARVFSFAGAMGVPLNFCFGQPREPVRLVPIMTGPDPSPFFHFYSKLLWLRELIYTPSAQMEAQRRHERMVKFLEEYRAELEWGRLSVDKGII